MIKDGKADSEFLFLTFVQTLIQGGERNSGKLLVVFFHPP
jgi:hypothetical protein